MYLVLQGLDWTEVLCVFTIWIAHGAHKGRDILMQLTKDEKVAIHCFVMELVMLLTINENIIMFVMLLTNDENVSIYG